MTYIIFCLFVYNNKYTKQYKTFYYVQDYNKQKKEKINEPESKLSGFFVEKMSDSLYNIISRRKIKWHIFMFFL